MILTSFSCDRITCIIKKIHWYFLNCRRQLQLYVHRKSSLYESSLYLPLGSDNLVLKEMGTPDEISSPPGWNRVSLGCPRNFKTELTEPTRQIKTTFPMNVITRCTYVCYYTHNIYMSPHTRHAYFLHLSAAAAAGNCGQRFEDVAPQSLAGVAVSCARLMQTYVRA